MSEFVCITNDLGHLPRADRPYPCRRRGMHYAACENPEECRGCVPRTAFHGYLCDPCWEALQDALSRLPGLIAHLRSIERSGQALGERVATSMERSILIPESWNAADDLMDALGARPIPSTASIDETIVIANDTIAEWWQHLEEWINTREGAKRAVVLIRRMKTALRRFPDSEAEWRHIPHLLCPGGCGQRSLFRKAPLEFLDECLVECSTEGCGYSRDYFEWQAVYAPIFEAIDIQMKRAERRQRLALA